MLPGGAGRKCASSAAKANTTRPCRCCRAVADTLLLPLLLLLPPLLLPFVVISALNINKKKI